MLERGIAQTLFESPIFRFASVYTHIHHVRKTGISGSSAPETSKSSTTEQLQLTVNPRIVVVKYAFCAAILMIHLPPEHPPLCHLSRPSSRRLKYGRLWPRRRRRRPRRRILLLPYHRSQQEPQPGRSRLERRTKDCTQRPPAQRLLTPDCSFQGQRPRLH